MSKRKPATKTRRGRRFALTEATVRHNAKVGEIVWVSNMLHGCLAFIFQELIGKPSHAKAMWDTLSSDKAQRHLLKAWIEASLSKMKMYGFPDPDFYLKEIRWIIEAADGLGVYRNAFVHTPVGSTESEVIADISSSKEAHARNIREIEEKQWFVAIRNDYYDLWQYAQEIAGFHITKTLQSSPERPQLRGHPANAPHIKQNTPNRKSAKPASRRRSLGA